MSEDLMEYEGAVDGIKILRGVAVAAQRKPALPTRQETIATAEIFHPHKPPQEVDIEPIIRRAIQVIGNREEAMRWLGTPVRALEFATPISLLHDPAGREQVLSVLTNLEHGVL